VEDEGPHDPGEFDGWRAADRLRFLFEWAGVPTTIPGACDDLRALAGAENWPDTPVALTRVRNTFTHPNRRNRDSYDRHSDAARFDVWNLGLWGLELCLLRLFGYSGQYSCRLQRTHPGGTETVPWA
jgi:hypothetical protein